MSDHKTYEVVLVERVLRTYLVSGRDQDEAIETAMGGYVGASTVKAFPAEVYEVKTLGVSVSDLRNAGAQQ